MLASDIVARRATLQQRIEALRRELGSSMLRDGDAPARLHDAILVAEREAEALDEAEAEAVRRERSVAIEAEADDRRQSRERIEAARDACLDDIGKAQSALQTLVASIGALLQRASEMQRDFAAVGGPRPLTITRHEMEQQASGRIAAALAKVSGDPYRMGGIEMHPVPFPHALTWRESAERDFARELAPILATTEPQE